MTSALRIRKLVLESDLTNIASTLITQDTSRVDNNHALITIYSEIFVGKRQGGQGSTWLS